MRGLLGSWVNRWWDKRGRRPASPASRPVLRLEALEDRRLLSAMAGLSSSALNSASLPDPKATVLTATSPPTDNTAGAAANAGSSSQGFVITQSNLPTDPADLKAEAIQFYFFAPYYAGAGITGAGTGFPWQGQASTTNATLSTPPPKSSSSASNAVPTPAPTPAQTVNADPVVSSGTQDDSSTSDAPVPAPTTTTTNTHLTASSATATAQPTVLSGSSSTQGNSAATQGQTNSAPTTQSQTNATTAPAAASDASANTENVNWLADNSYQLTFSDGSSFKVCARLGVVEEPTVPPPSADAADGVATPTTDDADSTAGAVNDNGAPSVFVVEISVARDPISGASPAASTPAATDWAALRLTITPPAPGQSGVWTLNLTPAPNAGDGTDAGDAGQAIVPPLDFVLQPGLVLGNPGGSAVASQSLGVSASDSAPLAAVRSAAPSTASPGLPGVAGAASSAPRPNSGGTATSVWSQSVAADLVLADWNGREDGPRTDLSAIPGYGATEWSAAGRAEDWQALKAEQAAVLSEAVKQVIAGAAPPAGGTLAVPPTTAMPLVVGTAGAGMGTAAGSPSGTADHWLWMGAPVFAVGGMILPSLGFGRNDALAGPGSDSSSQAGIRIAEVVKDFTESLTSLVRGLYRAVLGRSPENGEEQGWVGALLGGQTLEQMLPAFLSTAEFDHRAGLMASGTPDERYVRALYVVLMQRPATTEEAAAWLAALPELGRDGVAIALVRSNEFRALQVQGFYQEVYAQTADATDAAQWAVSPLHLLAIRDALAARPDLYTPAAPQEA